MKYIGIFRLDKLDKLLHDRYPVRVGFNKNSNNDGQYTNNKYNNKNHW